MISRIPNQIVSPSKPVKTYRFALWLAVLLAPTAALAEDPPATLEVKTMVESAAGMFKVPRNFILRAAEKMPEENYGWQPTPEVRTFAQLLGHIADGYRLVCGIARGDQMPSEIQQVEKTKTTKAELIQALTDQGTYCDQAYAELGGAKGAELVDWFGRQQPRVAVLFFNGAHAWEHYGNVVTYLRLKGIVPPSSEPRTPAPPAEKAPSP